MIKGTNEQEIIWNKMKESDCHIVVYAGAGVGKTFTIVEGSRRMNGTKKGFLAFNKSIATELGERLPSDVEAKTFHALGLAAFRNAGIYTKVNNWKAKNIISDVLGKDYEDTNVLSKLISQMKGGMVDVNDKSKIHYLMGEYNIEFSSQRNEDLAFDFLPTIFLQMRNLKNVVDFDDMIWLPLVENIALPTFDVLFVDEAQDFNEMQRELIFRCIGETGRVICVGDPNQAIYGFRGADSNSMDLFVKDLEKRNSRCIEKYPLSLTWRCPKNIVKEANRYVQEFHCMEDAEDGKVFVNSYFNPQKNDMVLCRYNAPLVTAFYDLVSQGKSAYILGRDMTQGLQNSVKKITKNMSMPTEQFRELLEADFNAQYNSLVRQEKIAQANALEDKFECLMIFVSKANTVGGILDEIKKVFDGVEKGDIMLSTVHKAKGLEADNVFILATERMPHPKASNPQEERNICYVAITRAKKNLYYVGPQPKN